MIYTAACGASETLAGAVHRADILRGNLKVAGDFVDDPFDGDRDGLAVVKDVADRVLGDRNRRRRAGQQLEGLDFFDRSLELADVGFQAVGNIFGHIVGKIEVEQLAFRRRIATRVS